MSIELKIRGNLRNRIQLNDYSSIDIDGLVSAIVVGDKQNEVLVALAEEVPDELGAALVELVERFKLSRDLNTISPSAQK